MKILAIETSCDETAICLLEAEGDLPHPSFKVLGNALNSQINIHKEYGGVYPTIAKREHLKNLPILLDEVLKEGEEIDVIAVTEGPGLEPALWAGITFAEELGKKLSVPVIPVNHMEGHIWSVLYKEDLNISFPALALLVSGGHTELVLVKDFQNFEILGKTRDDAVGEAFDKVARLLNLEYPGGPKISALARERREKNLPLNITFPRPMMNSKDLDFSYSGLKTSVLYTIKKIGELSDDAKAEIAQAFEEAAIEVLVEKTKSALERTGAKTLIVGGGVSGNTYLRKKLAEVKEEFGNLNLCLPSPEVTQDNAIMIGLAAYIMKLTNRAQSRELKAQGNLSF